ncbi:putative proteophosphoglycan 5 [Rosellinia necatrix]|uniref:Putative proteophosphoglycan 5 n=1 Tax=Rosellinia necatrix TaxID=77044 RepID=A0A1W2THW4_ROSNE|nr:putative proteophosphoglycan 5 [Rosellinia necatrix]
MRMPFPPSPKNTPNRRRPATGQPRNGSHKVYASENDVPSYKPDDAVSPSTPQKSVSGGAAAARTQPTHQKQKNKGGKNRNPKPGLASPGRRQGHESPSLQPQETSAPIFAGSTFHASPAPSALPLPSFLGLSDADSPTVKARESSPLTDSDEDSAVDGPVPRHEDSPLEFIFRADRAEKARVRRASSANTDAVATTAFSPLRDSSRDECKTFPRTVAHNSFRHPMFTKMDSSPTTNALDGGSRLPVGPAFSTPYQERIRAARLNPNSAQPSLVVNHIPDPNSSEALKRYLFTGQLGQSKMQEPHQPSPPPRMAYGVAQQQHQQQQNVYQASQPPPPAPGGLVGYASLSQPASSVHMHTESNARPERILELEGDLRRLLKLNPLG